MPADILTLHPAPLPSSGAARRRAMLLHPSNFTPGSSQGDDSPLGPGSVKHAEELAARFDRLHKELLGRGLPAREALTEVARAAARDIWDGFAFRLRRHRAAGEQMDANVVAVALASIQCMTRALPRHPGDLHYASRAVSTARRRLQYNGGLLRRLHPHRNPAFQEAVTTLESLEAFLNNRRRTAA